MKQNGPETINTNFALPAQLLEKFGAVEKAQSGDSEFIQAEANTTIEALKRGNPTELQIEMALAEIRPLQLRIKSLTEPEWANSFNRTDIKNESELASHKEQLAEAHRILKTALVKINPAKIDNYVEIQ